MARRCKHKFTRVTFRDGSERQALTIEMQSNDFGWVGPDVLSIKCDDCGEPLGLGESNDFTGCVNEEMAAARMIASHMNGGTEIIRLQMANPNELAESWPGCWMALEAVGMLGIGWWTWDSTKPIAGQYEKREKELAAYSSEWGAHNAAILAHGEPHEIGAHDPAEDELRDQAIMERNAAVFAAMASNATSAEARGNGHAHSAYDSDTIIDDVDGICTHPEIVPVDDRFARCTSCGDDTFPLVDDVDPVTP